MTPGVTKCLQNGVGHIVFIPQLPYIHLAYKVKNGMFALGEFTAVYIKGERAFW